MEMTIKQLADELGVCKQTISNAILQLNFQDTLHKVGNKYILSETQISQIEKNWGIFKYEECVQDWKIITANWPEAATKFAWKIVDFLKN